MEQESFALLFEFDTELLAQRQKLLTEAVSETKEKLETLKTAAVTSAEMYISDYKVKREADSSYGGLWNMSFTLNEF